jgi:hypothetical protein
MECWTDACDECDGEALLHCLDILGLFDVFPVNQLFLCKVRLDSYACLLTVTQLVEPPPPLLS